MGRLLRLFNTPMSNELVKNGKWPKRYRSEFIIPGLCNYDDLGYGTILIGEKALDEMLYSFIGKPVVNGVHNDLTPEEAFRLSESELETLACGVVYDVGRLPSGWYYCDFIVWDEETQRNLDLKAYNVSCAYNVEELGPGGKLHEVPYKYEMLKGIYTHHAIVKNPRYDDAKVYELPSNYKSSGYDKVQSYIQNFKNTGEMSMKNGLIRFLFNSAPKADGNQNPVAGTINNPPKVAEPEVRLVNTKGSYIKMPNGTQVSLEDAISAYNAQNVSNASDLTNEIGDDDEIEMENGKKVTGKMLKSACAKNACGPAQTVVAEPVVQNQVQNQIQNQVPQTVQNSVPQDINIPELITSNGNVYRLEKVTIPTVQNQAPPQPISHPDPQQSALDHFIKVRNAVTQTEEIPVYVDDKESRFKRGDDRYGEINKEEK